MPLIRFTCNFIEFDGRTHVTFARLLSLNPTQATGKILRVYYHSPTIRLRSRRFAAMRRILETHKRCMSMMN